MRSAPRQAWRAASHDGAGEPIAGRAVVYLDDVRVFQGVDSALPQLAQFGDHVKASIAGGRRRQGAGEEMVQLCFKAVCMGDLNCVLAGQVGHLGILHDDPLRILEVVVDEPTVVLGAILAKAESLLPRL